MATFHEVDGVLFAYAKGAPGHILALCTHAVTDGRHAAAGRSSAHGAPDRERRTRPDRTARAGGRVRPGVRAFGSQLGGLTFAGFIGLADPPAAGVKDTIARLRRAGLRTVMLTGDQRLTAEAVGREVGVLGAAERVVEGRELDAMSSEGLMATVRDAACVQSHHA